MKILVTGSNGLLGQKLVHQLNTDPEVELVATARGANRLNNQEGYIYHSMDISNLKEVLEVFEKEKPEVVIHTAAMTHVDQCEEDQAACEKLNVEAVQYIIAACSAYKSHLIHLSTDFIFNGEEGPLTEEADPDPLSYYGESKLRAEQLIQASTVSAAILRTVLVYGVAENMSRSNIVLWAKGALEKGEPIKVVDDQFRTPTLAEDLAQGCILAAKQKAQGVYNISGSDFFCIIDMVREIARFWNLDESLINPLDSSTLNQAAKRPPKTGFIIDKAKSELGYKPHSFKEGLALVHQQIIEAQSKP
ncbi:SDR family oxidoreductase [Croceimicrobium sp.]|uniref:SDR family oxidoreductase n=1 Tax=Croceimicrobium sp. TaxID=2828340 RepID=UPI003BA9CDF1